MNCVNQKMLDKVKKRVEILENVGRVYAMNSQELRAYQKAKIIESVVAVYRHNKFYKNRLEMAGFCEDKLLKLDDIDALPFMTKEDIREQYPFGLLSTDDKNVVRYGASTGTTGDPINSYYTGEDWFENNCIVATILSKLISADDTVALIVPYGLALVGQDLDRAMELIGAKTIAIDVLGAVTSVERAIKILSETKTTVLICSPSRALFIADEIKKLGLDPKKDFEIQKILCVGEGTSEEKARALKSIYGATAYPLYGMTETNTLALPCTNKKLHLMENKIYFEVINPETLEILSDGQRGELVVTSFSKAMPLIRYRTGDLVTIHSEACGCGSNYRYLEHHGRLSDSIIIGGKRIQILDLESVILPFSGTDFFSLRYCKEGGVVVGLVVGLALPDDRIKAIESNLKKALKENFDIQILIEKANEEKLLEKIKNNVKPSISSILQDCE